MRVKRIIHSKALLFILPLVFGINSMFAQSKWSKSAQVDLVFPGKSEYFYKNSENVFYDEDYEYDGFLLRSFGLQLDVNYFLFKKLSIGALGGFQTQLKPNYSFLKLGGVLKYYFVNKDEVYVYLLDANNFSLNSDKFNKGNNFRLGLGVPFSQKKSYNMVVHLFFEQNVFRLDGSKPLLGVPNEIPKSLTVKSFGVSFGVNF